MTKASAKPATKPVKAAPADPGPKPKMCWLPLAQLSVDQRYQRQINKDGNTHINRMVREFSWRKFQPLTVAPLGGGQYAVIDGQHRLEAARRHGGIPEVPCFVVSAEDLPAQAYTFIAVNKARIGVQRLHVFWAALAAGEAEAVRIKEICDKAKVKIARSAYATLPPCTTLATSAIAKMLVFGDAIVIRALKAIAAAQPEVEGAFRACTIVATVRLLELHKERIDDAHLHSVLEGLDFDDEIDKAKGYRKLAGGSLEDAMLMALVKAYNRGKPPKRLNETAQQVAA